MMKGGFYGLKGKQISFGLLALICTTVLFWAWDKTPLLTSLLPQQSSLLQLPPAVHKAGSDRLEKHHYDPQISKTLQEVSPETENDGKNVKSASFTGKREGEIAERETEKKEAKYSAASSEPEPPKSSLAVEKETSKSVIIQAEFKQVSDGKDSPKVSGKDDVASRTSENEYSSSTEDDNKNSATNTSSEACNYAKGKWVEDESRPLYSGFGCKQWLSGMWACRLTQRTDFAYEKLRWRPKDCTMEEFTGPKFLERFVMCLNWEVDMLHLIEKLEDASQPMRCAFEQAKKVPDLRVSVLPWVSMCHFRMRNKTLAFIGDSLGRQQFQSLMCMATGGQTRPDITDVAKEYGLVKHRGATRPDGWAYRFPTTNTTILYYWSASLSDLEPRDITNPQTDFAMHLDRPPAFLKRYIHRFNVLVLNTGHHWNRGKFNANRWVMHVGGIPNTDKKIAGINGAKNFTVHSIVNWVNSQLPQYPRLKVFFRTISPRHFFNGDWNTGGTCDSTVSGEREVLSGESSDFVAASAVKETKVKLLDITAISQVRDEGHISRYSIKATPGVQDCLHWCLPGIPDTWNEILFAQL